MILDESSEKFRNIWKKEFGKEIFNKKTLAKVTILLTLVDFVYRPIPIERDKKTPNGNYFGVIPKNNN